ncbi:hypothetical protein SAMN05216214_113104 [Atopomonas hussainii]|uniref:DUF2946 domain-containing protein n=1 Tax=Atopomonas hussainii TaxID=1429083 RepID=A0A1H7QWY7_9GAMM|nr:hypothetical protein [Atopomonas hussainii]SEL52521.1 hypothetical protein SAMN05216214_113104 [Atopomonas hussainii]
MLQRLPTLRRTAFLAALLLGVMLSVQAVERLEHDHPEGVHAADCALCCLPGLHNALPANLALALPPQQGAAPADQPCRHALTLPNVQAQARAPPAASQTRHYLFIV